MKFSQEETSIDNLRALCLRWNRAAAKYAAGSEYVDDPERVFAAIKRRMEFQKKVAHRKGELGIALLEQETSASLKLLEGSGTDPVAVAERRKAREKKWKTEQVKQTKFWRRKDAAYEALDVKLPEALKRIAELELRVRQLSAEKRRPKR